ncbi:hsdR [Citrobacter sp. NCU1]|uniref:hsdR n=1 Tax=Citrobacter sp. NCU1 TaxID=2026683 RepID=UPI0013913D40|nr:hsdR [Citrobacter sp. NCU1]NDO81480.1 hsdR [Citrobacter sp. NCU1]
MTKDQGTPLQGEIQALIENGLDFLNKARKELEAKQYKHSIVNFWTAVEIMLKVPLVYEHWTLVCSKKNKPKKQDYLDGDFQSVTYDETRDLFRDVLEKPISKETHEAFNKVRKHRNRVVHFYHSSFSSADLDTILKEQADAWFALNRLMRDEWQNIFGDNHKHILASGETRLLQGSKFYSTARLKQVEPELRKREKGGADIQCCPDCGQNAVVNEPIHTGNQSMPELIVGRCLVCESINRQVRLHCPSCGEIMSCDEGELSVECDSCHDRFERYELLGDYLLQNTDEDEYLPAGCTNCMSPESVAKFGNGYLCTRCLNFYNQMVICNFCDHMSDAVPEFSHIRGCEFCDGDKRYLDD